MTLAHAAISIAIGLVAGILSGLFGVGGGIVMTPGIDWFLPVGGIVALETPLPVIFPTSLTGAITYGRVGELDVRAAAWMAPPGLAGSVAGALLTEVVDPTVLLLITALLLAYQSLQIVRARSSAQGSGRVVGTSVYIAIGLIAGFVSGLLGIGGGLVMVPLLTGWLGMPLKRALGTSLLTIPALVIPGTVVHAVLGHIDWGIFAFVTLGAVPGSRLGARIALGAAERTLRLAVGAFMFLLAIGYCVAQIVSLVHG